MRRYLLQDIGWILLCAVIFIGVPALIVFGAFSLDRHGCYRQSEALGVETRFGWAEGCLFESDGRFVPDDIYRLNEEAVR